MAEILNLDYNLRELCIKALNKCGANIAAAELLGCSEKTLIRYKNQFSIKKDPVTGNYFYLKSFIDKYVEATKDHFSGITNAETVE